MKRNLNNSKRDQQGNIVKPKLEPTKEKLTLIEMGL